MNADPFLNDIRLQFEKYRLLGERALDQVDDTAFFETLSPVDNSIAIVVKHIAGNMHSRWTDFLTTDGEKPSRDRDREFEREDMDSREDLMRRLNDGWAKLFAVLDSLSHEDLFRKVTIRGEPHTVVEALNRQATHYAYHVGQIVLLARHFAGDSWQSLSIPKGKSKEFDVTKFGKGMKWG